MATYKPGTHINLKKKDEYALLVTVSNLAYKYITPILAAAFLMDWALRVNGL